MPRRTMIFAAAFAFAGPAAAPSTAAGSVTSFRSPSANIYCAWANLRFPGSSSNSLRCDVRQIVHRAPRPRGCQFDWGQSFGLAPRGPARALCVSDSVFDPRAAVLRYGHTLRLGPFRCTSLSGGMHCSNADGRGFVVSRGGYRFF